MGVENNEAIIATTWDDNRVVQVKDWVATLDPEWQELFAFLPSIVNGKTTIVMAPDGSKKGWDDADEGKRLRHEFMDLLRSFNYDDGSNPFDWVEVGYGEFGQTILQGNCVNVYNDAPYATMED